MPSFGKRSKENLYQSHIDLQTLFNEVVKVVDCSVICGYRGEIEQNEAYDKGFSKLRYPKSQHNKQPSMAVDVVPFPIDWQDTKKFNDFGKYVLKVADKLFKEGKISNKIEWGGNWDWKDLPHYQIH